MTAELDAFTLVLVAGAYLLGGAALLAVVNMLLKGLTLSAAASFAKKGAWQKSVQEVSARLSSCTIGDCLQLICWPCRARASLYVCVAPAPSGMLHVRTPFFPPSSSPHGLPACLPACPYGFSSWCG